MPHFPTYPRLKKESGPLLVSDKLIFIHFGKTAGSSVLSALTAAYPERNLFPDRGVGIEVWPSSLLDQYDLFAAHAALSQFSMIPGPRKTITFLRNPLERAVSEIEYHKSYREDYVETNNLQMTRLFRLMTPAEIYTSNNEAIRELIDNPYTYWLAGNRYFSSSGKAWQSDDEVLEHAIETMDNMSFVGVSENLDLSLEQMAARLDMPPLKSSVRDNLTNENWIINPEVFEEVKLTIDSETLELISNFVRLDTILYDMAVERLFKNEPPRRHHYVTAGDGGQTWRTASDVWLKAKPTGGWVAIGPYCRMMPGDYEVEFSLKRSVDQTGDWRLPMVFDVAYARGTQTITFLEVRADEVSEDGSTIRLPFKLPTMISDVEFRAYSPQGSDILVANEVNVRSLEFGESCAAPRSAAHRSIFERQ